MPDGSLGYLDWYLQWVRESYPTGKGVIHPLNKTILNPWAVTADATGIERPNNTQYIPADGQQCPWHAPRCSKTPHASFDAYQEFMADHLDLKGGGCFGGRDRSDNYLMLMFLLPFAIVIARSPGALGGATLTLPPNPNPNPNPNPC